MKTWKLAGVASISALLLYYPLKKLFEYVIANSEEETVNEVESNGDTMKVLEPELRDKRKALAHHRR